jgi:hypothetical protein
VSEQTATIERLLTGVAGGYLHNIVRDPGRTCEVCATPTGGYPRCWRCRQDAPTAGLADLVVPLIYGIAGQQSGTLLRHYKDNPHPGVRFAHVRVLNWLLYLGITVHQRCLEQRLGAPVTLRLAVPSLRGRPGLHPFLALARGMDAIGLTPALEPADGATSDRIVSATQFTLTPQTDLSGQHVLILDDTWTTGSRAQSAALTVRRAGAQQVSVMVVGRWLDPDYGTNAAFIADHLRSDYQPHRCPVTGGQCP